MRSKAVSIRWFQVQTLQKCDGNTDAICIDRFLHSHRFCFTAEVCIVNLLLNLRYKIFEGIDKAVGHQKMSLGNDVSLFKTTHKDVIPKKTTYANFLGYF